MSEMALQQQLTAWVGNRSDASAKFVERLVPALKSPEQRKLWAFVDIRREFETLVRDPEDLVADESIVERRNLVQMLLPIFYVAPILITWFELGLAVRSYREESRNSSGQTIDFLAVWSGAQGNHAGLGIQWVAVGIVTSIILIMVGHVINSRFTSQIEKLGNARHDQISALLLDAQLVLVKSRAVTPEDMADSLTLAAGVLQDALTEVAGVLPRFETISTRLDDVVSGLAGASQSLDSTSRVIGAAANSLNDLPARAAPLVQILGDAPGALQGMLQVFTRATNEASNVNRSIVDAGEQLTKEAAQVAGAIAAIGRQLSDLVREVGTASSLFSDIPKALAEPARVARDLAEGLESATPVAIVFRDGSEQMRESIKALGAMVQELKYAADQYRTVNEQNRQQN